MGDGGTTGSFAYLAGVVDHDNFVILGCGSGFTTDHSRAKISSARTESMGVAAGMSKFADWKGKVTWKLDNHGVTDLWRKTNCH